MMSRSTGNWKAIGATVMVALLIGLATGYLCSRWQLNNRKLSELKQAYGEVISQKNPEFASVTAAAAPKVSEDKGGARLSITFRAIGHSQASPAANQETAFEVLTGIKGSDYFDATETKADGNIGEEVPPGTFSFKITTKLKRPLTL